MRPDESPTDGIMQLPRPAAEADEDHPRRKPSTPADGTGLIVGSVGMVLVVLLVVVLAFLMGRIMVEVALSGMRVAP